MDLFKLIGKVIIDNTKANEDLDKTADKAHKAGGKIGSAFTNIGTTVANVSTTVIKGAAYAIGATTVAVGGLVVASTKAYAQYEQLVGGVDTLFKESSKKLQSYANEAYKTAGMSANSYMAAVTSFSASLLQGVGGDTDKAADYANQALIDMSDNANKFGTDLGSIQETYQGFSKQNFTMLDNLKLGFGGTKEEMQRLLDEAEKISGIKYDISNFADITKAINVVQTELGITGTTAKEASTTISGSLGMVKSSFDNLLVGIAGGGDFYELTNNLVDSVGIAFGNLLPVVQQSLLGVDKLVREITPMIFEQMPVFLNKVLPKFIELGGYIFESIISGITQNMPMIVYSIMRIINMLTEGLPFFVDAGFQIITALFTGISESLPEMIPRILEVLNIMVSMITTNLPIILQAGLILLMGLMQGLVDGLPTMLPAIIQMLEIMINMLAENLPLFIDLALQIVEVLAAALIQNIHVVVRALSTIIQALILTLSQALPQLVHIIIVLLFEMMATMQDYIPTVLQAGIDIITAWFKGIVDTFKNLSKIPTEKIDEILNRMRERIEPFAKTGHDFIQTLINAFLPKFNEMWNSANQIISRAIATIKSALSNLQNFFISIGASIRSVVTNAFEGIKTSMVSKMTDAKNSIISIFSSIQKGISEKLEGAKNIVSTGIQALKGFFNFEWSLPKIKLPHFKISGEFSLNPPGIPSFGVEWYKNGGIMMKPTAFGVNPVTGRTMVGGEAGTEAIAPIETLLAYIRTAVSEENEGTTSAIEKLISLLATYLPQIVEGMTKQIVLDNGTLVGELAPSMDVALGNIYTARGRGK